LLLLLLVVVVVVVVVVLLSVLPVLSVVPLVPLVPLPLLLPLPAGRGRCWPPSEKESGVMLRMAMTWVLRDGLSAWMGGWCEESGVMVVSGVLEGGSASR
jgi:hypothetical protein